MVCIAFSWDVHHDKIFTELILVRVIHSNGVMVHLAVVLHGSQHRSIVRVDARGSHIHIDTHQLLLLLPMIILDTILQMARIILVAMVLGGV